MDLMSLVARLTLDKSNYDSGLNDASNGAKSFGDKLKSGLGTAAKVGTAALATVGTAATAATTALLNQAGEVAAYGDNIDKASQKLGISAEAYQEWDAVMQHSGSSVDGFSKGLMNISAALDELTGMPEVVIDSQKVEKTKTAFENASLAVEKSRITYDAAVKEYGKGSAQAEKALLSLQQAQNKAALAQSEYNSALEGTTPDLSKSTIAIMNLGVATKDSAGQMRNQEDVFADVITALQEIEDVNERTTIATTIFGKSAKELGPLLNTSAADTQAMKDRVHELGGVMSDEAVKAAAAYQDNLQDMNTAIDGVRRNIVSKFIPGLSDLMAAFTDILAGDDPGEALEKAIDSIVGAMNNTVGLIVRLGEKVVPALVQAIVAAAPGLLDGAAQIVLTLGQAIIENLPMLIEAGLQVIVTLANAIAESLPTMIPTIVDVIMQIVDTLTEPSTLSALLDAALAIIIALAQGLIGAQPKLIAKVPEIIMNLVTALIDSAPQILEAALQLMVTYANGVVANTKAVIDAIGKVWDSIVSSITGFIAGAVEWGANLLNTFTSGIVANINAVLKGISQMWDSIVKSITNFISGAVNWGKNLLDTFTSGIVSNISSVVGGIGQMWDSIVSGVTGFISGAWNWGKDLIDNFTEGIKAFISKPVDAIKGLADKIKSFLGFSEPEEGPLSNFHTYAPDMMELFAKGITDNRHLITDAISSAFNVGGQITHTAATGAMTGHEFTMPSFMPRVAPTQINLILDNTVIGRALLPYIRAEEMRVGIKLAGGVH